MIDISHAYRRNDENAVKNPKNVLTNCSKLFIISMLWILNKTTKTPI